MKVLVCYMLTGDLLLTTPRTTVIQIFYSASFFCKNASTVPFGGASFNTSGLVVSAFAYPFHMGSSACLMDKIRFLRSLLRKAYQCARTRISYNC